MPRTGPRTQTIWTRDDLRLLRRHYGRAAPEPLPLAEVSARLGRPENVVSARAWHLGLSRYGSPKAPPWSGSDDYRLRRLAAAGRDNAQIAEAMGRSRTGVRKRRAALGLPASTRSAAARRVYRRTCGTHGQANLSGIKGVRWRVACLYRGWPLARTPRECDVLDAVSASPGGTSLELTAACGFAQRGLSGHGGRVFYRLEARGLIVRRVRPRGGGGYGLCWTLAPGVAKGCGGLPPDRNRVPKAPGIRVCGGRYRAS